MYNNSLDGFHSREDTYLCYKKITREYRLIRDFNLIARYEVSQSVLLGCTRTCMRTDTFVNNKNISSNLSSLDRRWEFVLGSESRSLNPGCSAWVISISDHINSECIYAGQIVSSTLKFIYQTFQIL